MEKVDKETKQEVVNTILHEGVDFVITVTNPNILHKLRLLSTERKFIIYPIHMGTLLKIAKVLADVDVEALNALVEKEQEKNTSYGGLINAGLKLMQDDGDKLLQIVAYGIHNKRGEPSKSLINFLHYNISAGELLKLLVLVIRQMDVQAFLACMVSVIGMNITETTKSQKDMKKIHGESSEQS